MIQPDNDVPYVLGQQRKTLAELRAELDGAQAASAVAAHAAGIARWRASIVIAGAAAVGAAASTVVMALAATTV